jgi:hypothetical protein
MIRRKPREAFEAFAARVISAEFPIPDGERRYQRVYREQQQRRRMRELRDDEQSRRPRKIKIEESYEDRLDNLGESPDF